MRDSYETAANGTALETFEWDNPWWEHTEDKETPRVLYIGDSISRGVLRTVNDLAAGRYLFDNFSTSKALDNPFYEQSLELFMSQQIRCDYIIFNNGLHGWHLGDEEYGRLYKKMLGFLKGRGVPVFAVLTTNLPIDAERRETVINRNRFASLAAEELGCGIIDLYSASLNCTDYCGDGVHIKEDGCKKLAAAILEVLDRFSVK